MFKFTGVDDHTRESLGAPELDDSARSMLMVAVGTRLSVVEQRDDPGYAGNPRRKHAGCFVLESSK